MAFIQIPGLSPVLALRCVREWQSGRQRLRTCGTIQKTGFPEIDWGDKMSGQLDWGGHHGPQARGLMGHMPEGLGVEVSGWAVLQITKIQLLALPLPLGSQTNPKRTGGW